MRSPADMEIIQIDVTNVCPHICANCTRFCGHHKKPFFMDPGLFDKAVNSLTGFPGTVGVMGGEPTLHPKFGELVECLRQRRQPGIIYTTGREPIVDFAAYAGSRLGGEKRGIPGLWTSLGRGYYKHFEAIQDIFGFQVINDHRSACLHQALLMTRQELGIPDDAWKCLRDKCWIQNLWSASITPKGAFFCEVAAALDMLFDGPGGWPIEPGWWKRTPDQFGDQLQWCEWCSAALQVPRDPANFKTDRVSPRLLEKLTKVGSPKLARGLVRIFEPAGYKPENYTPSNIWFLPDADDRHRIEGTCDTIRPQRVESVWIAENPSAAEWHNLAHNLAQFDAAVVVTDSELPPDAGLPATCLILRVVQGECWTALDKALARISGKDWIFLADSKTLLHPRLVDRLKRVVLNPGCLYTAGARCAGQAKSPSVALNTVDSPLPSAFWLFNVRAKALRSIDLHRALASRNRQSGLLGFPELWPLDKSIVLRDDFDVTQCPPSPDPSTESIRNQLMQEHVVTWFRALTDLRCRYALFGAGKHTAWLIQILREHKLPLPILIFDDHMHGQDTDGITVQLPARPLPDGIDAVVLSTNIHAEAMATRCRELWGSTLPILDIYSGFTNKLFEKK